MTSPNMNSAKWTGAAILLGACMVMLFVVADYGVSWDESVHSEYAERVTGYFSTFGADRSCNDYKNLKAYGPGADLLAATIYQSLDTDKIKTRHLVSACFALLTVPALYLFGRLLGNLWIGVVAGGLLLLMPQFVGHACINLKDIPFACLFTWSIAGFASLFTRRTFLWPEILFCGVVLGLTAAIRPAGFLMLSLFFGVSMMVVGVATRHEQQPVPPGSLTITKLAALFGLGWLVMVIPWPWAHENPLLHPLLAMGMATRFYVVFPVLFEGQIFPSDHLPWYYLTKYIMITTPPPILFLAMGGVCTACLQIVREPRRSESLVLAVMLFWLLGPLAMWTLQRANIYDGMRHFLFLLPAIAVFAGVACGELQRQCRRGWSVPAAGLLGLSIIWTANECRRLHPYQMTYHNMFVGGLAGAEERFETDYWATSYKEGMEWINQQAALNPQRQTRVLVAANDYSLLCAEHFRARNVDITTTWLVEGDGDLSRSLPPEFDFYLATYRDGQHRRYPESPITKTVSRDGAVFAVVRANKPKLRGDTGRQNRVGSQ